MSERRLRPPKELEFVLDRLKEDNVFQTKAKGLIFAAAVGYRVQPKLDPDAPGDFGGEGIRLEYFEKPRDSGFIDVLAVASTGTLYVLEDKRQEERLSIFERYAAIGLERMKKACYDSRPELPLLGLLNLLDELRARSQENLPGLEALAEKVGSFL